MVLEWLKKRAANLFPGYFALVMATGALSVAAYLLDIPVIPHALLFFNLAAYLLLWSFVIVRLIWFFPRIMADLTSHTLGPGFFTFVAGTCVLGSQLVIVAKQYQVAFVLWLFGIFLWIVIMYTFFTAVTVSRKKPTLALGINGAWLIASVATQSVSMLGTLISSHIAGSQNIVLFFSLSMYLLGAMLYLNIITLIFYRFTFLQFKYASLTPPYWINMGAVAITTLAGSTLMLHASQWPMLLELMPFLKGFTLFFWITGTWWIPLLFILMTWRYLYHRYPLTYDPQLWGMVFPLAMYTTGTFQLSKALGLPFLLAIPRFMILIAMFAWVFVFVQLLYSHRHIFSSD